MPFKRAVVIGFMLVAVAFAIAAWLYPALPNPMPTHWNAAGQPDGYTPKPWGPFVLPLTMLGTWGVLSILPAISPRGFRLDSFIGTYGIMMLAILASLLIIALLTLLAAHGERLALDRIVPIVLGALMVVLGNYLGKLRKNFFIGIRTPWTLASDEVWARTHRLGGWLFVLAGLTILVIGILKLGAIAVLATVLSAALVSTVYSYIAYRRLEGD